MYKQLVIKIFQEFSVRYFFSMGQAICGTTEEVTHLEECDEFLMDCQYSTSGYQIPELFALMSVNFRIINIFIDLIFFNREIAADVMHVLPVMMVETIKFP
ncbi:Protein of unknown function [Cotesia congregata]|uniref:Uncharacterized protein n=1 Tax=Cotesia congregata TaxID=51543 RepID=A0A8J2HMG2_COTCN|nr:Protein of unknown function [Cotesia congregata]